MHRFGTTRKSEQKAREELERIAALGADYRRKLKEDGVQGMDAGRLKHLRQFVHSLHQGELNQGEQVKKATEFSAQAERTWRFQQQRVEGIDSLVRNAAASQATINRRREQANDDEIASRRR